MFHNISSSKQHWLQLRLVGTRSNRDGIGAKIRLLSASGLKQYNHVTTSVGYACSSTRRVHFGLGGDPAVESIAIVWPSGQRQVLKDVKADQCLVITEPD